MKKRLAFLLGVCGLAVLELAAKPLMPMVPKPDSVKDLNGYVPFTAKTAIVLPESAEEPLLYASERFQQAVKILTGYELCQPSDADLLIKLKCENGDAGSLDGFKIDFEEGLQPAVIITGKNPRSVIYGQETLLQLFEQKDDGSFMLRKATIEDQARLKLRAFGLNRVSYYTNEILDAYSDARLNCIELRDGPESTMFGQFGFQAGTDIPVDETKRVLKEAHRRGMYVYGVVCCGVKDEQNDLVLKHFQTLIELGVDGLYISFDDPGTIGNAPQLVGSILELARKNNYSMDDIAFLPPAPDYGRINTKFNKDMLAAHPELADARWYFTAEPSPEKESRCKDLGLRHKRGYWFNWAMGQSPEFLRFYFFNMSYMVTPTFSDNANLHDLTPWMQHGSDYLDSAMVWVRGYPEYLGQYFGTWAWNPEKFDAIEARKRSYARLYGIDLVDVALMHDELITDLKASMARIGNIDWIQCVWGPAGYNDPYKLELINKARQLQEQLKAGAPAHCIANQDNLQKYYLLPMFECLDWLKLLVETKFPEEIQPNFDRDLNWERDHGREKVYLNYWESQIEPALKTIEERFGKMTHTAGYVARWRAKIKYVEKEKAPASQTTD